MSIQLKTDEMLSILYETKHPRYQQYKNAVEAVGTLLANAVSRQLDCKTSRASYQGIDLAGTCAGFYPKDADQPCPYQFTRFDDAEGWEEDCEELKGVKA